MVFGADYPFLEVVWTLIVIFAWVIWFWLLITVFADLFRRHDIGGGKKAVWIIFVILVPFVGVLIYLIANSHSMAERNEKQMRQSQAQTDAYIRSVCERIWADRGDRACEGAARQRRDQPGRVRRHQGEGALGLKLSGEAAENREWFPE